MKIPFKFPNTQFCLVVTYRPNKKQPGKATRRKDIRIPTPASHDQLQTALLAKGIGYSEIRAIKADPSSPLKDVAQPVSGFLATGLKTAMTRFA